jgi:hypothetical protein
MARSPGRWVDSRNCRSGGMCSLYRHCGRSPPGHSLLSPATAVPPHAARNAGISRGWEPTELHRILRANVELWKRTE